jgi:tRNA uridine 5-carboxymethylaminomethyl modification enzyme
MAALNRQIDATKFNGQPLSQAIRASKFELSDLEAALAGPAPTSEIPHPTSLLSVFADRKYEPYLVRQHAEIKRQAELEHRRLPDAIDYHKLTHLRTEARQALIKFRPRTFGQAGRLEGITPADLTLLSVLVHR